MAKHAEFIWFTFLFLSFPHSLSSLLLFILQNEAELFLGHFSHSALVLWRELVISVS